MRRKKRKSRTSSASRFQASKYLVFTTKRAGWILISLLTIALVWWLFFAGYFTIQSISCKKDSAECGEQIMAELNKFLGSSLLTFRSEKLVEKLKQADPAIDEVLINTRLPNQLFANIRSRRPEALLKTQTSSNALIADASGMVFAIAKPEDSWFPTIEAETLGDLSIGQKINDSTILSSIKLATTLREYFIPFQKIQVATDGLHVVLKNEQKALFPINADFSSEVSSLQRILSQVTIEDKPITIDLRTKKPVVTFD
jgi:cell division septal protein FtsQ